MEHFHTTFNFLCTDCQKRCPRFIGEICASDNNTYWNKCTFEIAKCEAKLYGVTLTVKNNGPCNSKHPGNYLTRIVLGGRLFILMTVTSSSSSHSLLRQVLVMKHFHATYNFSCTDCLKPCPRIRRYNRQICASDGNTYWNECTFEIAKCEAELNGGTLTVKNEGPCKRPGNYLPRIVLNM